VQCVRRRRNAFLQVKESNVTGLTIKRLDNMQKLVREERFFGDYVQLY
jgi:hypothetical protein